MSKMPCPVIVMAKAPVAGYAKTRLIPALGAAGAAALAQRLLDHAVAQALAAGLGTVDLCCAPDATHAAFQRLGHLPRLELSVQGDGDLGARMRRALDRALAAPAGPNGRVLMIGTDAPTLDVMALRAAADALLRHDAVFIPAHDGGYALVGLSRPAPALFDGMAWSTPQVMAQTRERASHAGLRIAELAPVHDIDEPADLVHVPPHLWPHRQPWHLKED